MSESRLILIDLHPLEPFLVRSNQFLNRAASFAQHWNGPVELWLPEPALDRSALTRRLGMKVPENLVCSFGPPPFLSLFLWKFKTRGPFRQWVRRQMNQDLSAGERCLFYFRTLRLADSLLNTMSEGGGKFIYEPHEVFFENARKPEELKRIELAVCQRATGIFPISHALEQQLKARFSFETPTEVGPLGHNGANFSIPPYDLAAPPSFLYIGSLHKWKGLEVAFEASAGLNVPFDVVGDAGGLERCRAFCRQRGFEHVVFHGQMPPEEVSRFYRPGSICLLPLSNETIARVFTSPLKLFEYLAAGRPVIVGDTPTAREIVTDRVNARLVPINDISAWRSVLTETITDRAGGARLGKAARELAQTSTWEERARPLVKRMRALIDQ
jgi:glycosyltransferase involved in cell wall biosynthesis